MAPGPAAPVVARAVSALLLLAAGLAGCSAVPLPSGSPSRPIRPPTAAGERLPRDIALAQSVLEAQSARFEAMKSVDVAALDGLLDGELTYTHTVGVEETKEEFIASLRSGTLRYHAISSDEVAIRDLGDAAVLTGLVRLHASLGPQEVRITARFTEVQALRGGQWRLVAWQSTRLPD